METAEYTCCQNHFQIMLLIVNITQHLKWFILIPQLPESLTP